MNSLFRAWKTITPRRLFLVDGLGAVLSASSLGLFLPAFERTVGLPTRVLYALAVLASGLAAGSLWNCWHNPRDWRTWLKGIAWANLVYEGLTVVLLLGYHLTLTVWGGAYFGLELAVIVLLARWKLHTAVRPSSPPD